MKTRGDDLKFGEYQFAKGASLRDVVETIIEGKVVQHQLTVAEGLTSEQIVARLLENDKLTGNDPEVPREGTLLPDTYHFTRGTTREQIDPAHAGRRRPRAAGGWERRIAGPAGQDAGAASGARLDHREGNRQAGGAHARRGGVRQPAEAEDEAAIRSDHHLRSGRRQGFARTRHPESEISQPTPYNTYVIDGLPPGPIANPGRASIEAAANPARTKELFFVADGTGGHAFAETYDQHQKNVAKLRGDREGAADAASAAAQPAPAPDPGAKPANSGRARPRPPSGPPTKSGPGAPRQSAAAAAWHRA